MHDGLGNRMKDFYEGRYQTRLPRRTYTIIRVDGKAFHTYTRGLATPFDHGLIEDMNTAAAALCKEAQNAVCAYVQSDEISVLLADFKKYSTDAWFDGNVQKIVSVSASTVAAAFNKARLERRLAAGGECTNLEDMRWATFDARTFSIPDPVEVENYFIWRQQDATRNSVFSAGRHYFSHQELDNKNNNEVQQMLLTQKDVNWNDYPVGCKRGRFVIKTPVNTTIVVRGEEKGITRQEWRVVDPPIFSQDTLFLRNILSRLREEMQGREDGEEG